MQVHVAFPNGNMLLKHDEPLDIGRGKFSIDDMQVSRQHMRIVFSNTTETVVAKSLSQSNPSFVWRSGSKIPITLREGDTEQLFDGDRVSLLHNKFFLGVSISKFVSPGSKRKKAPVERTDTVPAIKRKLTQTPSFEETENSPKKQRVQRASLSRAESSFIHPKNLIGESELKLLKVVGAGTCGEVWKANWNGNPVAVKKIFRALLSDSALKEFRAEAKILSSLRHPNVVQFWGFSVINGDNCIVTEFMARGALNDVLYSDKEIGYKTILKFALGAAEGIRYLHAQKPAIIHRDIKTMNFLVGNDNCVKVADFGLARHIEANNTTQTFCGTVPWTAPELLAGKAYSTKVDVYAFGIVLWELCARKMPYDGMTQSQIIVGVVTKNLRPEIPKDFPSNLSRLMEICWDNDPDKRPNMEDIIAYLRKFTNDAGEVQTLSCEASLELEAMELTLGKPIIPFIREDEIKFSELLASRSSHKLYAGTVDKRSVLIQVFDSSKSSAKDEFTKELEVLSKLISPVIPTAIGYSLDPKLCIVTERIVPDLRTYLQTKKTSITMKEAIAILWECAKSMTVLHTWTPPLLHRDLTSSKFLLYNTNEGSSAKIGDVAQARFVGNDNSHSLREIKGEEMEYCAPECFDPAGVYSTCSDVYSFGIVMWEVLNRQITGNYQKPYFDVPDTNDITFMNTVVRKLKRPMIPQDCPHQIQELIEACWHPVKEERPSFADLSNCLSQFSAQLESVPPSN